MITTLNNFEISDITDKENENLQRLYKSKEYYERYISIQMKINEYFNVLKDI